MTVAPATVSLPGGAAVAGVAEAIVRAAAQAAAASVRMSFMADPRPRT